MSRSVLFIGHEASRTGAPILLLHFMRWLRAGGDWSMQCVLGSGGDLAGEYAALCPTRVLDLSVWRHKSRPRELLRGLGLDVVGRLMAQRETRGATCAPADLVYCNTIAALPLAEAPARMGTPILCHVHELEFARLGFDDETVRRMLLWPARFVACAPAVADVLVERHRVPAEKIDIVHEFIPTQGSVDIDASRAWLRHRLGLPADAIVAGGSGQPGWRKGTDIFAQVAARARGKAVHFMWLGGREGSMEAREFAADVRGLGAEVTIVPTQPDPLRYLAGLDLFLLTSREDPYPLVCLEAATCGVPILCFDKAGGMPGLVRRECVLPYLDMDAMALLAAALSRDAARRHALGAELQAAMRERHDVKVAAPMLLASMERALKT